VNFCRMCNEDFGSVSAFDAHRVGTYYPDTRRCLDDGEMLAKHWRQDSRGRWRRPVDRSQAPSLRFRQSRSRPTDPEVGVEAA
jgi:hypothetical protein